MFVVYFQTVDVGLHNLGVHHDADVVAVDHLALVGVDNGEIGGVTRLGVNLNLVAGSGDEVGDFALSRLFIDGIGVVVVTVGVGGHGLAVGREQDVFAVHGLDRVVGAVHVFKMIHVDDKLSNQGNGNSQYQHDTQQRQNGDALRAQQGLRFFSRLGLLRSGGRFGRRALPVCPQRKIGILCDDIAGANLLPAAFFGVPAVEDPAVPFCTGQTRHGGADSHLE